MVSMKKIIGALIVGVLTTNIVHIDAHASIPIEGLKYDYNQEQLEIQSAEEIVQGKIQDYVDLQNWIEEKKRQKEEEERRKAEEEARQKYIEENTIDIVVSFYTALADENGGYAGITCEGKPLSEGMVATIDELPLGATLETDSLGTLTIADRMNRSVGLKRCKNGEYPIDMYIARNYGESDYEYKQRVLHMGVQKMKAVVYYN